MTEAFPVSGNIEPASFPHLLVDLHRHGATGSLKVTGASHPKALYFRNGRILFGSSNDPRDQLGAILIESGRMTRQQLDEVNSKVGPGNPLAKVLTDGGFVNQRELGDAARVKVERILADVLSWDSGSFEFEDGVLPKGAVDLKLSTEKLLLAAVQRIPDRSFALRHVDLDTVLEPTPDAQAGTSEIRAEVWPLLERLDGRRTLKDAISLTRSDEFEGAKTACALLFLGVVRPRTAEPELDLAQEAQSGFGVGDEDPPSYTMPLRAPEATGFAMAEPQRPEPEPPLFAFEPEAPAVSAAPAPTFAFEPEPPREDPALTDEAPRAAADTVMFPAFVEAEPVPEPHDEAEEPMVVADAPHDLSPDEPTFIMAPPAAAEFAMEAEPEASAADGYAAAPPRPDTPGGARGASRPSQEDLAALDALLNPSGSGRSERPVEKPAQDKWEPQFRASPTPAPRRPPARVAPRQARGGSRLPIVLAGLAGILLATVAAWYFLLRAPAAPQPIAAATPRPAATAPLTTMPVLQPTPPAPAAPSTAAADTAPPVAKAPAPNAATAATAIPAPAGDPRALLAGGSLPEAARSFAASLAPAARSRFSLQLLTACSPETVQKAVGAAASAELFILPVALQGRSCYRVCWGLYDSRQAAEAGASTVPAYFRQGGARPRLSPLSELLP